MNKVKVSMKDMKENYRIVGIGYCAAQYLLQYEKPVAYSSGSNGWNCDFYDINGMVISTGYNYLHNKNTRFEYSLLQEYEKKAQAIIFDYSKPYEQRKNETHALLIEFLDRCKE